MLNVVMLSVIMLIVIALGTYKNDCKSYILELYIYVNNNILSMLSYLAAN
jgi:hypothetical protein